MAKAPKETPVTTVESVEEVVINETKEVLEPSSTAVEIPTSGQILVAKAFMADPARYSLGATEVEVIVKAPKDTVCICGLIPRLISLTKIRMATYTRFVGTGEPQSLTLSIDNFGNDGKMFHSKEHIGNWEVI